MKITLARFDNKTGKKIKRVVFAGGLSDTQVIDKIKTLSRVNPDFCYWSSEIIDGSIIRIAIVAILFKMRIGFGIDLI